MHGFVLRALAGQAVEQLANAHNAGAQLAQAEHQPHGDAFITEVVVDRANGGAAGIQPLTQAALGSFQTVGGAQAVQHFHTQAFYVTNQVMERPRFTCFFAHAQAQLGRKAGGQHLACTVGDGVEQGVLPVAGTLAVCRGQQMCHALQQRLG